MGDVIEIKAEKVEEVEPLELRADLEAYKGYSIPSNLARLTEACEELARDYRGITSINADYTYKDAKRDRAALNRSIKQIEDERKRVKGAFTLPLTEFECGVKSALRPLTEAKQDLDAKIKDFETDARAAKRVRLEAYWEQAYPALALCTGEDEEPLVPFSRVLSIVGGDWLKKMSEVGEGHDGIATGRMDELADNLAHGAEVIAQLSEPAEVRAYALSELYRCFNVVQAIDSAKREYRRQKDIERLGEAQAQTGVPEVPRVTDAPPLVTDAPELHEMPEKGSFEPVGYVVIPIRDKAHKEAVIAVMKKAGVSGSFKRTESVHFEGGSK